MSAVIERLPPISFTRRDLTSSSVAEQRCMLVYPRGAKSKQRIAMGDRTGALSAFSIGKQGKRVDVFTSCENGDDGERPAVSCMTLFGDQLFCICGSVLSAYTRKGTRFFTTDTNATEKIHSLYVSTPFFFVAGDFMVTAFQETKELGFFISPDRVHDMTAFISAVALERPEKVLEDYICCLACNDRVLRLVQNNQLIEEVRCEAPITVLHVDAERRQLYYGTKFGSIAVFDILPRNSLRRCYSYLPSHAEVQSHITCLSVFDVNADNKKEILVGYEDGAVRVFGTLVQTCNDGDTAGNVPGRGGMANAGGLHPLWSGVVGEKVMSIAGGIVTTSVAQPDLLVHVFSGLLISFVLDGPEVAGADEEAALRRMQQRNDLISKKNETEAAIAQLQAQILSSSKELARRTGAAKKKSPLVAVASTFNAQVRLNPLKHSSMLSLVVDADVPIEHAVLRGSSTITFVGTETTQVIPQTSLANRCGRDGVEVGRAGIPSTGKTRSLALARPWSENLNTKGGRRLEVHLWPDEDQGDRISVTLYANPAPRTAQVKTVLLCALPLYARVSRLADAMAVFPSEQGVAALYLSKVLVQGQFKVNHVFNWLAQLLPDMSEVYQGGYNIDEKCRYTYYFTSEFLNSLLIVDLTDRAVTFTSDSLTALSAIKRFMVRQAASEQLIVSLEDTIRFNSAMRCLSHMEPMILRCAEVAKNNKLLKGLQELQSDESDLDYLPDHLQQILHDADGLQTGAKALPQDEAYLKRSVVALYKSLVDFTQHTTPLTSELQRQLEEACCWPNSSYDLLVHLFFPKDEHIREKAQLMPEMAQNAGELEDNGSNDVSQDDSGTV
ncbi:unnamed protein product [Phytomonas sp. EM1]|nr:unnamed protein product [Phytomonas sp. EM1]|eukprot:CCW59592.1 unnamed protein product [Phytomonas sp. isolate EM1]